MQGRGVERGGVEVGGGGGVLGGLEGHSTLGVDPIVRGRPAGGRGGTAYDHTHWTGKR